MLMTRNTVLCDAMNPVAELVVGDIRARKNVGSNVEIATSPCLK